MSGFGRREFAAWLLALAFGAAAIAWQLAAPGTRDGHAHDPHHAGEGGPQPLFGWAAAEAVTVALEGPGLALAITRGPGGWTGGPAGFDAEAFVAMFSQAKTDRRFAGEPGHDYGLSPPGLRIRIGDAAGRVLADVSVGGLLPDGIGRYARIAGQEEVVVLPDYQVSPALRAAGIASG